MKYKVSIVFCVLIGVIMIGTFTASARNIGGYLVRYVIMDENNYKEAMKEVIGEVEWDFDNGIFGKYAASTLYTDVQLLMGKKVISDVVKHNYVYKMDNGQLTFINNDIDVTGYINRTMEFNDYLIEKKLDFVFIQAPHKVNKYNNQLPYDMEDTINPNADRFIEGLKNASIPVLDLRESFKEAELDYEMMFYNTDHHWTYEAALFSLIESMNFINKNVLEENINIAPLNSEVMENIRIEECYLGAQGRRVGSIYGGIDDFSYYLPKNNDIFMVNYYDKNWEVVKSLEGYYNETVIDENELNNKDYMSDNYHGVLFDDFCVEIINENKTKEVLLIRDSFGVPFSAYLGLLYNRVTVCDLRYLHKGLLEELISNNDYDLVIMMYNPSMYENNEVMFEFLD